LQSRLVGDAVLGNAEAVEFNLHLVAGLQPQRRIAFDMGPPLFAIAVEQRVAGLACDDLCKLPDQFGEALFAR
jgi:hypothetical protein